MILDFTISNFRSIKESQTISFEATNDTHLEDYYIVKKDKYRILKIATILGANASGKSNVIRAFSLIHNLFLELQDPSLLLIIPGHLLSFLRDPGGISTL